MTSAGRLHHVELYVASLDESCRFWEPFLGMLGYEEFQKWNGGISYKLDETYIVLVQAEPEYLTPPYHRKRVGLNHLAFHARSARHVDEVTAWVEGAGYRVLYRDRHPHAGGPGTYALYCEDPNRIKVDLVAPNASD